MIYLTTKETCLKLKVHHNTLRKWRKEGKIQFTKLSSKAIRFPEDEVNALLAGRKEVIG